MPRLILLSEVNKMKRGGGQNLALGGTALFYTTKATFKVCLVCLEELITFRAPPLYSTSCANNVGRLSSAALL
jgi:hypothetical protein